MSSVSTSSSLFGPSLFVSAPAVAKVKSKASVRVRVKMEDGIDDADDSISVGLVYGKSLKRSRGQPLGAQGGKRVADQQGDEEELGDGEVVVARAKRPRLSGPGSSALPLPFTVTTEPSRHR